MTPSDSVEREGSQRGWSPAKPELIPSPTWTPAALAFGVTLIFWGIVTSPLVSLSGLIAVSITLVAWIGEICNE